MVYANLKWFAHLKHMFFNTPGVARAVFFKKLFVIKSKSKLITELPPPPFLLDKKKISFFTVFTADHRFFTVCQCFFTVLHHFHQSQIFCIGANIRKRWEIQCLQYAGFQKFHNKISREAPLT